MARAPEANEKRRKPTEVFFFGNLEGLLLLQRLREEEADGDDHHEGLRQLKSSTLYH